jgi:PIN domain nuclease of toxin-antitoxin system
VIVLDSSALLAALFEEPGRERVRAAFGSAMMSIVNALEVVSRFVRDGHDADQAAVWLTKTALTIEPIDWHQTMIAARLAPIGRQFGLSLGDRVCLALAIARDCPVLTADRAWAKLDIGVDIELIR